MNVISPERERVLAELLNVLVPADDLPSAVEAGAIGWFEEMARGPLADAWNELLGPGIDALLREALALDEATVGALEQQQERAGWEVSPAAFIALLVRLAGEVWLGVRDSPAWEAMGYLPGGKSSPGSPVRHIRLTTTPFGALDGAYDAVVVGAGAGGGVAARVLAEAGMRVLLLDRGEFKTYDEIGRDHLRNQRLGVYGNNGGPDPYDNPRVVVGDDGQERVVTEPWKLEWHNNAMTVGGGTRLYQGMAWRFHPDDFRMASKYGVPQGSTLTDWPISYADLEPYYARAERELGVAGAAEGHINQGFRSTPYPMGPLLPDNVESRILRRGAAALGLSTGPVPLLINSRPRGGRAACIRCGECVGFACPTDAKNGTHNTVIPVAMATGRCTLATGVQAERVVVDHRGRAVGVALVDLATGARTTVRAAQVILSAGAIETARLLLNSATDEYPDGLGNRSGMLGRNLQGHLYTGAFGLFDETVQDSYGPGVSIATADYYHRLGDDGIGGGVLANECVKIPAIYLKWALRPDAPRWGAEGKREMRTAWSRTSHIMGPIQEIPNPDSRVMLARDVVDAHGVPVARLSGQMHEESIRAGHAHRERAAGWMEASGARRVWRSPIANVLSAGQHQAGTARMGHDEATSVTDPFGRVHGHGGLWVMDASLHVTNGGVNPVLTILALAYRCAEELTRTR